MFLNISNHPSRYWPLEQSSAALRIASPIVDFPFPDVSPHFDSHVIAELAQQIAGQLPPGVFAAMVQGESTLTFAIVSILKHRGIPCFAAASARVSSSETLPSGSIRKTSEFRFVRFREYPEPC